MHTNVIYVQVPKIKRILQQILSGSLKKDELYGAKINFGSHFMMFVLTKLEASIQQHSS